MNETVVERVARAIATENGDDYDLIPVNKPEWVRHQGQFMGRFRDVTEPFQVDYDGMATAATAAHTAVLTAAGLVIVPREPTEEMIDVVALRLDGLTRAPARAIWRRMITKALEE